MNFNTEQPSFDELSIPSKSNNRKKDNQGQKAVTTGFILEEQIENFLKNRCFYYKKQYFLNGISNIYGSEIKVDLFVSNSHQYPDGLIIECKWQGSQGSVDEKYPYLILNIKERYNYPTIIVYGGNGAKSGAIRWLKQQADGKRLIAVYGLEEFIKWATQNL